MRSTALHGRFPIRLLAEPAIPLYTNLDSEKGFAFFQKFLKDSGILADLERAGIQEGDTVRMYGLQFDYYK